MQFYLLLKETNPRNELIKKKISDFLSFSTALAKFPTSIVVSHYTEHCSYYERRNILIKTFHIVKIIAKIDLLTTSLA